MILRLRASYIMWGLFGSSLRELSLGRLGFLLQTILLKTSSHEGITTWHLVISPSVDLWCHLPINSVQHEGRLTYSFGLSKLLIIKNCFTCKKFAFIICKVPRVPFQDLFEPNSFLSDWRTNTGHDFFPFKFNSIGIARPKSQFIGTFAPSGS